MVKKLALLSLLLMMASLYGLCQELDLNGKWDLEFWPEDEDNIVRDPEALADVKVTKIQGSVPGNVLIDLQKAGVIDDPRIGNNIDSVKKYENYQWVYSTTFKTPGWIKEKDPTLTFDRIDCLADIWINGNKIGSTDNSMIPHDFNINKFINEVGENNEIKVIIRSSVIEAGKYTYGSMKHRFEGRPDGNFIRRSAHSYGFDITPRLIGTGIWGEAKLKAKSVSSLKNVFWMTKSIDLDKRTAKVIVDYQIEAPRSMFDSLYARVKLERDGKVICDTLSPIVAYAERQILNLSDVDFWWPRGYGKASLYEAKISLENKNGRVYSSDLRNIGIRTVKLERSEISTKDKPGKFQFFVNGIPIFIKGTNWVALDVLHSRDAVKIGPVLEMLADLNCNMVRNFGGNLYENDQFYDFCDSSGILIWQDFAFSHTIYPQDQEFLDKVRDEVLSVVLRLRNHPALTIWCGNNEIDVSVGWQTSEFNIDPNGDKISREVIPYVLFEFDLTRPYLPSSPYLSEENYRIGNNMDYAPEQHLWGPRGYYKDPYYTNNTAKFVSEIGYHGIPNRNSLGKMFSKDSIYPWRISSQGKIVWNDEWKTKRVRVSRELDTYNFRLAFITNQMKILFGKLPTDLDTIIQESQAVQAEAMKYFIEFWRSSKFDRSGIIWWNLRDGWPIISDAVTDYYNSKKLAYYFIKNVQRDVCVMINDTNGKGKVMLNVVNDTRQGKKGKVKVTDIESGRVIYDRDFVVDANDKNWIANLNIKGLQDQGLLLINYEIEGQKYNNHYLYGEPVFDFAVYLKWLKEAKLYDNIEEYSLLYKE